MINYKTLTRFLIVFIISYTLLLLPQTGIDRKYAEFFCSTGNTLFHHFGKTGYVVLKTQQGKDNISLFLSNTLLFSAGQLKGHKFDLASNLIGYYYTAFFLALVFATPLAWKRKTVALILGFIITTGFVMFVLRIIILNNYANSAWMGLYQDAASKESISFWYRYLGAPMTLGYSFVVIAWLGLCIGKEEWKNLNGVFSEITTKKTGKKIYQPVKRGSANPFARK